MDCGKFLASAGALVAGVMTNCEPPTVPALELPVSAPEVDWAATELCERHLIDFVKESWPLIESASYIDNWHISAICEHLEAVTRGEIPKLLINIPPGCNKSLLVAVFWPVWEWINDHHWL